MQHQLAEIIQQLEHKKAERPTYYTEMALWHAKKALQFVNGIGGEFDETRGQS